MKTSRRVVRSAVALVVSVLLVAAQPADAVSPHAASQDDISVVMRRPHSGMVDQVLRGVATHWSWSEWVNFYTWINVEDPDGLIARVQGTYVRPNGETFMQVRLKDDGSGSWTYSPDAYFSAGGDGHAEYGTWTIDIAAYDADGAVLASSSREIESRDPMTAAHPRFLSLHTKKNQTRRLRACPPDTDHHRYCQIRVVLKISDPDRLVGYAFITDKGRHWHRTGNWYGARVHRDGDIVTFRDSVPVSAVGGRHRLFVRKADVTLRHFWETSYMRRWRAATFNWRLHLRR